MCFSIGNGMNCTSLFSGLVFTCAVFFICNNLHLIVVSFSNLLIIYNQCPDYYYEYQELQGNLGLPTK